MIPVENMSLDHIDSDDSDSYTYKIYRKKSKKKKKTDTDLHGKYSHENLFKNIQPEPDVEDSCDDYEGEKKLTRETRSKWLYLIYTIAIVAWITLVVTLHLYTDVDVISGILLVAPVALFIFSMANAEYITVELENKLFQVNTLTLSLLVIIPLLSWMCKDYNGDKSRFINVIVAGILLALISLVDVWVRPSWLTLFRHIRSIFQTLGLFLIILAFYNYYLFRNEHMFSSDI